MDLDEISKAYLVELGSLLLAVQGAQSLGLASVDGSKVRITPLGKSLLRSDMAKRKRIIKKQLGDLHVFKVVLSHPAASSGERVHKRHITSILAKYYSKKDAEKQFRKLVEWGRYAQLVVYDADTEEVKIVI
jgi:NitT/TauT family transport system ATP-binding protein